MMRQLKCGSKLNSIAVRVSHRCKYYLELNKQHSPAHSLTCINRIGSGRIPRTLFFVPFSGGWNLKITEIILFYGSLYLLPHKCIEMRSKDSWGREKNKWRAKCVFIKYICLRPSDAFIIARDHNYRH